MAKVEWHPGELYPRVGYIVTNLARPAERVVAFYNQRGTAEQWIKEGKGAIKWTRLSCRTFAANAVRLQLHALAYNLGNLMRTLAMPKAAEPLSLTSLREKLIKIGAKVVSHGRYVSFQLAEVAVSRQMSGNLVADRPIAGTARASMRSAGARCDKRRQQRCASTQAKQRVSAPQRSQLIGSTLAAHAERDLPLPAPGEGAILGPTTTPNPGNVG